MLPPLPYFCRGRYMQSPGVRARLSHRPLANSVFHRDLLILSGPRARRTPRTLFRTRCGKSSNMESNSFTYSTEMISGDCDSIRKEQDSLFKEVKTDLAVEKNSSFLLRRQALALSNGNNCFRNTAKSGTALREISASVLSPLQNNFRMDIFHALDKHEAAVAHKVAVHGANLASKDGIDGHAQGRGLSIHSSAPADYKIGLPDQIQSVQDMLGDDNLALRYPISPLFTQARGPLVG